MRMSARVWKSNKSASKTEDAHEGCGLRGRGLAPDVHVPFTPEECARDLVLERALVEP